MAKKRRLNPSSKPELANPSTSRAVGRWRLDPRRMAAGGLGATVVYLTYHPSDAASVEAGDALWMAMLSLAICLFAFGASVKADDEPGASAKGSTGPWLDVAVWSLSGWMMFVALVNGEVGNLRMATNEAWLWISGAAIFTSVRRIGSDSKTRRAIGTLIVVCAAGLAVHAMHQQWVTLPLDRLAFEADPDRVLAAAQYDAPPYSAERAIFAGRLMDGGPTATFALANSLAAVLMAGMLISVGIVRFTYARLSFIALASWLAVAMLCAIGLWMTESRSGVIASLCGLIMIALGGEHSLSADLWDQKRKLVIVACAGAMMIGLLRIIQHPALASAQASLMFRFQYWRSTLQMIWDRPWFGAGPGNFQVVYDRYRESTTAEQIADPHNLFFETLGSGGVIGLVLLVVCCLLAVRSIASPGVNQSQRPSVDRSGARAVWIGAGISLALVWLLGFASRQLPDLQASLFVLPVVGVAAALLIPSSRATMDQHFDRVVLIVAISVGIHLLFSGGWTVPGVAIVIWLTGGMATHVQGKAKAGRSVTIGSFDFSYASIGFCIVTMGALYFMSLRPVQESASLTARATYEIQEGRYRSALRLLEQASVADPWASEPVMALADLWHWQLIGQESDRVRGQWNDAILRTKRLGCQSPSVLRAIGVQQMHLYQRHGRREDLAAASETFETALQVAPVNQWLIAQLASIVGAQGDSERSELLVGEAKRLSDLGINTERRFEFQLIYPAEHYGPLAARQAIRRSAADVLSEPR